VGAHGVGKTRLCELLYQKCTELGTSCEYVKEVVRECPLPINDKQGIEATMWVLCRQIQKELEAESRSPEIVVCDRSSYDPLVYLLAANPEQLSQDLTCFCESWARSYDKLLLVRPSSKEIVADEFRAVEKEGQYVINTIFTHWIVGRCRIIEADEIFGPGVDVLVKQILEV